MFYFKIMFETSNYYFYVIDSGKNTKHNSLVIHGTAHGNTSFTYLSLVSVISYQQRWWVVTGIRNSKTFNSNDKTVQFFSTRKFHYLRIHKPSYGAEDLHCQLTSSAHSQPQKWDWKTILRTVLKINQFKSYLKIASRQAKWATTYCKRKC